MRQLRSTSCQDLSCSYRAKTSCIAQRVIHIAVLRGAVGKQRNRIGGKNVVSAEVLDCRIGDHLQVSRSACQVHIQLDRASPAGIPSMKQGSELSKLAVRPIEVQHQRRLAQRRAAPDGTLDSYETCIAEVCVGAHRPCLKAHVPFVFGRKPEREIGLIQGVHRFFESQLQVDSPAS